jgi:hypothetical protein
MENFRESDLGVSTKKAPEKTGALQKLRYFRAVVDLPIPIPPVRPRSFMASYEILKMEDRKWKISGE